MCFVSNNANCVPQKISSAHIQHEDKEDKVRESALNAARLQPSLSIDKKESSDYHPDRCNTCGFTQNSCIKLVIRCMNLAMQQNATSTTQTLLMISTTGYQLYNTT